MRLKSKVTIQIGCSGSKDALEFSPGTEFEAIPMQGSDGSVHLKFGDALIPAKYSDFERIPDKEPQKGHFFVKRFFGPEWYNELGRSGQKWFDTPREAGQYTTYGTALKVSKSLPEWTQVHRLDPPENR